MEATFEGVAVLVIALLPGAIYTWAFERLAGRWGIAFADRLYRFFGLSAFYQALFAPLTWKIWLKYLRHGAQSADKLPWWLWPAALLYIGIPALLGSLVAHGYKTGNGVAKWVVGSTAAPTAWDAVFSAREPVYVLMRLKSGRWIGGKYADGSHVSGFPQPADIYFKEELVVDQEKGDFVFDADTNLPRPQSNYGLLVRWEEVEYLEISS